MSRRRKEPQYVKDDGTVRRGPTGLEEYYEDRTMIGVGCTGRGSHRRIVIGTWEVLGDLEMDDGTARNGDDETFKEDYEFVSVVGAPQHYLYAPEDPFGAPHITQPIRCGYCGRSMPSVQSKLYRRLRVLKAIGVSFLDLSSLDAIVN